MFYALGTERRLGRAAAIAMAIAAMLRVAGSLVASQAGFAPAADPGGPVIDRQPIARLATEGGPVAFSVIAHGTSALSYQWWRGAIRLTNDSRLSGATNGVLVIHPVLRSDASNYSVVVSTGSLSVTSAAVSLTVTQMLIPQPTPLGSTGVLVSIFAMPGDVYRVESSVDFAPWVTNGYATNVTGQALYRDFYAGSGFRRLRVAYERLLPLVQPPQGAGAVPTYGTIGEVWRLRSSPDLQNWSDVETRTNTTGWVFFTNAPVTPSRFYRIAPPLF